MTTNERIALGMGWKRWREANPQIDWASMPDYSAGWGWASPEGKRETFVPDYEHSLDALLEPLGVLRERGWCEGEWDWSNRDAVLFKLWNYEKLASDGSDLVTGIGATPSEALALAVAEALEASK